MICPNCETEYREGFTTCADCGEPLVEELTAETAMEAALEPLLRTPSGEAMSVAIDALEQAGIPYVLQAGTALALLDGERLLGSRPADWEARIWVVAGRLDEARELLRELRRPGQE